MEYFVFFGTLLFILIFILIREQISSKKKEKELLSELEEKYHIFTEEDPDEISFDAVKRLFERNRNELSIDDITAHDVMLDDFFLKFDKCESEPGKEFFYNMLRNPVFDPEAKEKINEKTMFLSENPDKRLMLSFYFKKIGLLKKVSLHDCMDALKDIDRVSLIPDYLTFLFIILSIVLLFFDSTVGVLILITAFVYNILTYYKRSGKIEPFIVFFSHIIGFLNNSKKILKSDIPVFKDEFDTIKGSSGFLNRLNIFSFFLKKNYGGVGIGNLLMDYLKMTFHLDIIAFYKMKDTVTGNRENIEKIYAALGSVESMISIAAIRDNFDTCTPKKSDGFSFKGIYIPFVDEPVKNDLTADRNILITGSNASGKSTFLKAVALNSILVSTINTCFADEFLTPDHYVYTSMALEDDLKNHESYFMAEINAIKRIYDFAVLNPDKKVLVLVDEVLRGTNTIDRIAAASEILESFPENVKVFAATHDIELTNILKDSFSNYHFDETVKDDDVIFEYLIKEGPVETRNALRLLSVMGFDEETVKRAEVRADKYLKTGEWT